MEPADYLRRTLPSALVALAAVTGCALPPELGFASRSDNLLHTMLQGETTPAKGSAADEPPAAPAKEVSPYPTALKPNTVAAPVAPANQPAALPLQQGAAPLAMQLDRNKLAGRLPHQIHDPATIQSSAPPAGQRPEQQASFTQATETSPPDNSVATVNLQPTPPSENSWPAAAPVSPPAPPLEVWNQFYSGPVTMTDVLARREARKAEAAASTPSTAGKEPPAFNQIITNAHVAEPAPPATFVPPSYPESPSPSDQPASANLPIEKSAPEPVDHLLERLIVSLEEEIRQKTERKETEDLPGLKQKLRLLQLIADRTDDAVDQVEQLPPAEREAFKQLMFALSTWLSPDDARRSSLRNAKILRSLSEVNSRLSAVSKLDLKSLMFCEKVESYGWFTEFPRAEFAPKQQVILYVEVQNFAAEEKTATAFETELAGSYQIFDTAGNIIDEHQLPLDREVCRNFRRDYFLAYRIHLPADIQPGRYRLELTVEDLKAKKDFKGRKQGEAMIEFAIK